MKSVLGIFFSILFVFVSGVAFSYFMYDYLNQSLIVKSVPEPAAIFLLGTGLIGLAVTGRRKVLKKY